MILDLDILFEKGEIFSKKISHGFALKKFQIFFYLIILCWKFTRASIMIKIMVVRSKLNWLIQYVSDIESYQYVSLHTDNVSRFITAIKIEFMMYLTLGSFIFCDTLPFEIQGLRNISNII